MSEFRDLKKLVLNDADYRSIIASIYRSCEYRNAYDTEKEM